jgi:hypothetical protein
MNSIINALLLHYMQTFILPSWVLTAIQKSIKRYLWRGGQCLVSRQTVTLPKKFGGLGIIDLRLQNIALILKWLWIPIADIYLVWSTTLRSLGVTLHRGDSPPPNANTSHFLRDIFSILSIFNVSVELDESRSLLWYWLIHKLSQKISSINYATTRVPKDIVVAESSAHQDLMVASA